jgi:GNAT superfamily N-acetyltransferase
MKSMAISNQGRFELRRPDTESEWSSYHCIRRRALWDKAVQDVYGPYDPDHPAQYDDGYTALVMLRNGIVIGTMGLLNTGDHGLGREVEIRGVAIDPACQSQGYGGVMLMMGENAAHREGFKRAGVWSGGDVVLFYARNGYIFRPEDMPVRIEQPIPGGIAMTKRLDLGVAQNDGSVLIAAA